MVCLAFGLKRKELNEWKIKVANGDIAIITHYWLDPRFPNSKTVTKVGCCNIERLKAWGRQYGLKPEWIHERIGYPHFDVLGDRQIEVLKNEHCEDQIERFALI